MIARAAGVRDVSELQLKEGDVQDAANMNTHSYLGVVLQFKRRVALFFLCWNGPVNVSTICYSCLYLNGPYISVQWYYSMPQRKEHR